MATIPINGIFQIKLLGGFMATPYDRLVTTLNYRADADILDPASDVPAQDAAVDAWITDILPRIKGQLPTVYAIQEIRGQVIYPANVGFESIRPLDLAQGQGALSSAGTVSQTAAACLTRRSYKAGRRGMGRVFFGPLASQFINGDTLVPDPTGLGDLDDVEDALGQVLDVNGTNLHPCVFGSVNATGAATDAEMDIRIQLWSSLISHLKTRRPNSL